jgi:hypothetical protein
LFFVSFGFLEFEITDLNFIQQYLTNSRAPQKCQYDFFFILVLDQLEKFASFEQLVTSMNLLSVKKLQKV